MSSDTLSMNTPVYVQQCGNVQLYWSGGVEPYYVGYIAAGTVGSASSDDSPAVSFRTDQHSRNWTCNVASGVQLSLNVRDSSGQTAYSSPFTVQPSNDESCLPGYSPPGSSGLSRGAIGGIVAGVVVGLIILGAMFAFWYRRKRRRRAATAAGRSVGKEGYEEHADSLVEPYVGRGGVDLGDEQEGVAAVPLMRTASSAPTASTGSRRNEPMGQLEREVKQMLGVGPSPSTNPSTSASRSPITPIPAKFSNQGTSASHINTAAGALGDAQERSPQGAATNQSESASSSPVGMEQQVEYVRHTDGGVMQVELPPLYSDVPRRE